MIVLETEKLQKNNLVTKLKGDSQNLKNQLKLSKIIARLNILRKDIDCKYHAFPVA